MMKNFAYVKAGSLAEAIKALSRQGAYLHAGGMDLLGCARSEILQVDQVVSISRLKDLMGISKQADGGVKIGALTPLADIAVNPAIAAKYAVLAQAAAAVGTPQIRQQGTIGGTLCQKPRCWYYRSDIQCLKKGGPRCYAATGENQYHAIFGGGPCFFVHPSDVAVALVALQAQITVSGRTGNKNVKIDSFFVSPKQAVTKENILLPGEIVTEVRIPPVTGTVKSSYMKIAARGSWDFALASVAAVLQVENDSVHAARIVLGGVAPYPWRAEAVEKLVIGKKLDTSSVAEASAAAASGAFALKDNAYKLDLVKGAVEESLSAFI
jgi:xanthine dehydrogenase YagS FAD-binding subunit